jgi:hypothetical protein
VGGGGGRRRRRERRRWQRPRSEDQANMHTHHPTPPHTADHHRRPHPPWLHRTQRHSSPSVPALQTHGLPPLRRPTTHSHLPLLSFTPSPSAPHTPLSFHSTSQPLSSQRVGIRWVGIRWGGAAACVASSPYVLPGAVK